MTLRSASPDTLDALPNPRGGAVRPAEQAIADALDAFEQFDQAAEPGTCAA